VHVKCNNTLVSYLRIALPLYQTKDYKEQTLISLLVDSIAVKTQCTFSAKWSNLPEVGSVHGLGDYILVLYWLEFNFCEVNVYGEAILLSNSSLTTWDIWQVASWRK